ncbi:hypothetical protein PAPYR_6565 [Paratrimastix pyriformis]|uniref:Uncharacterized protein n=1 Tax=Paratrimastix pyriformis TaxID=342808 RepID=A0ABQ8UF76_9EUKA|nr:hypothetical protein PAPYR_6565 [Paratrimastix pyriformis]
MEVVFLVGARKELIFSRWRRCPVPLIDRNCCDMCSIFLPLFVLVTILGALVIPTTFRTYFVMSRPSSEMLFSIVFLLCVFSISCAVLIVDTMVLLMWGLARWRACNVKLVIPFDPLTPSPRQQPANNQPAEAEPSPPPAVPLPVQDRPPSPDTPRLPEKTSVEEPRVPSQ